MRIFGDFLLMRGHFLKAAVVLTGLLLIKPLYAHAQTAVEYLQSGNNDLSQGNLDQAIFDYTKVIDMDPNLAKAYDNRGVAYAQEGSLSLAIADFTMAIANKANDAEAYNNRGHAYAQQGNFLQAVADYSKAIDINPIYVKAYNNREIVYYKLKEYAKAWSDVYKVKEIGGVTDPKFVDLLKQASGREH